ncbi:hypothetical protein ABZX73_13845 [Brevibacterium casei]
MTEYRLYPRLSPERADPLRSALVRDDFPAAFNHDQFESAFEAADAFPATGGRRMSESELLELRSKCLSAVDDQGGAAPLTTSQFDLRIGRVLYEYSVGSTGEFGNSKVWDFITLVLLPDLATERFSGTASSAVARFSGGNRRHVFQRLWRRWNVFGEEVVARDQLTEDDYGALLERRLTSERREIALRAAESIIKSGRKGSSRREYTRILMRQLVQISGIVELGGDELESLDAVFAHLQREAKSQVQRL